MSGNDPLCGIDEAGRGPLAGPLVVCGVILHAPIEGLSDSKKLSAKQREALFEPIMAQSTHHVVIIEADAIDAQGISACMKAALLEIRTQMPTSNFLFDGNTTFGVSALQTLVKADDKIDEVRAASIVAKVTRDRLMVALDATFPEYGFKKHMGYGSAHHIQAIQKHGYTPHHRKSFKIKALEPTLF